MTNRAIAVVVVAAGKGERLGATKPKAFVDLVGKPLLSHAIKTIAQLPNLAQLVVVVPESHLAESAIIAAEYFETTDVAIEVVVGGSTRQESVAIALGQLADSVEIVLIHDAARALTPVEVFERVIASVVETGLGTVPTLKIFDTIKRVDGELIRETVNRDHLRAAQTPQGFLASQLKAAYLATEADFTDDAALMQSFDHQVRSVEGHELAFKVTTAADFELAKQKLGSNVRTGIGTDVHRFTEDASKPLYLGTVIWPGERGLDGHSDGDAVSHAIVDALLSAAGLGDIGSNFGVDRPEFAGANGQVFLEGTLALLASNGFAVQNVAVQIIGNRPKVAPHRSRVEAALTQIIGAPVALSATTTDGLGFLGDSQGVAAVATALVVESQAFEGPNDRLKA